MRIGIIEDDRMLNHALKMALEKEGFEVSQAFTFREAKEMRQENAKEELLLIDVTLPDGNGIHLYEEIVRERAVPAIFLTACDEEKESLGMTMKQQKGMLIREGMGYFLMTVVLLIVIGIPALFLLSFYLKARIYYFVFRWPVTAAAVILAVFLVLCMVVAEGIYWYCKRKNNCYIAHR